MIITRTPLRISFFGGGTDLPRWYMEHGGAVLSTTIDKYHYIICRKLMPYWEYRHQLRYGSAYENVSAIDDIRHPSIRETMRFFGIREGLDMQYSTDIPAHSGMGSSSAFTVGFVHALYGMQGKMANKRQLALDAIHIEQNMIKEAVGAQDQVAVAFGGLNYIEFKKNGGFFVHPVLVSRQRKEMLERHLVLVFSGFQRFATDVEMDKLANLDDNQNSFHQLSALAKCALDILTSNEDIRKFGEMLNHAWQLKKSLSQRVTTEAIDRIYNVGIKNGAIGGKLLGAGGGGFLLFFCEPEKQPQLLRSLNNHLCIPFRFEENGSQVIYYREE